MLIKADRKIAGATILTLKLSPSGGASAPRQQRPGEARFLRAAGTAPAQGGARVLSPCEVRNNVQMFKFYYQYGSCFLGYKKYI